MIIPDRLAAIAQIAKIPLQGEETVNLPVKARELIEATEAGLDRARYHYETAAVQGREILNVSLAADAIEEELQRHQVDLPSVIAVFTGGFKSGKESQLIGVMGEGAFSGLFKPDIHGHPGEVYLADLGQNQTGLVIKGRVHPYEFSHEPHANMLFAHNSRVYQELARRNRARGRETSLILTFLTGVDVEAKLPAGEIAVVVDEAELANDVHPGLGPHGLFDIHFGLRWQAKAGRAVDPALAREFLALAQAADIKVRPAISFGTPGRTEFESTAETGLIRAGFREARKMKLLAEIVKPMFGRRGLRQTALFYDMGITAELAVFRQVKPGELDIPVLPLVLATDTVGGRQSLTIDHLKVIEEANAQAGEYSPIVMDLAARVAGKQAREQSDFSVRAQLVAEGVYK